MLTKRFVVVCLLAVAVTTVQVQSATSTDSAGQNKSKLGQSDSLVNGRSVERTGRIMKVLKDPKSNPQTLSKRYRAAQKPQSRRDRFPPPGSQRPLSTTYHRSPVQQPPFGGMRNQVLRRVHNGPPPNAFLRPQYQQPPPQQSLSYEQGKPSRFPLSAKENVPPIAGGKGAVYRPQFASGSHPNALPPQGSTQLQFNNFKASPQYSGSAIVRPASEYPQYAKLLQDYARHQDIQQHPLPQQHPQHQQQQQQFSHPRPGANTAPQTFPAPQQQQQPGNTYTEPSQSAGNGDSAQKMYSVYEDPELNERAPFQYSTDTRAPPQNPPAYNPGTPQHASPETLPPMAAKEAEEYLKFMSTNEYFLPKFDPNYRRLDEERDMRRYKQQYELQTQTHPQPQPQPQPQSQSQKQPQLQYSKTPPPTDASGAAAFHHPIAVSQLFYHPDASPASTIVRSSYQAGNNAFVVKSDGNKAVKHIVPSSHATQGTTTPSIAGSYTQEHFNPMRHRTPEPIRFEFTEHDAVLAAHTNAPPSNGHLRYKAINGAPIPTQPDLFSVQAASSPTTTVPASHNRPISVNEVDSDPEDGDDMQDAGTGFYGRVPIRSSTESMPGSAVKDSTSTTPATEQKDTEEYCESICANVQDDDEEIVCGSDGYMYTGEAQMECYASCLHIDVTIQGKGTCSAR